MAPYGRSVTKATGNGCRPGPGAQKRPDRRVLRGTARRGCGRAACGLRVGAEATNRRRRPAAGWEPGGAGKKKSRASGPARVNQVGMSGCSVLAPTGHCSQTSQTGAEEEHGGGLRDRGGTTRSNPSARTILLIRSLYKAINSLYVGSCIESSFPGWTVYTGICER